jgi:hypothetical protein
MQVQERMMVIRTNKQKVTNIHICMFIVLHVHSNILNNFELIIHSGTQSISSIIEHSIQHSSFAWGCLLLHYTYDLLLVHDTALGFVMGAGVSSYQSNGPFFQSDPSNV